MDLLELTHETDPRYLIAPYGSPPNVITFEELVGQRYGRMMITKVGPVIARYEPVRKEEGNDWKLISESGKQETRNAESRSSLADEIEKAGDLARMAIEGFNRVLASLPEETLNALRRFGT